MKLYRIFPLILLLTFSFDSIQAKDKARSDLKQRIQEKLDSLQKETNIPGITFAVAFENGETFTFASGLSDLEDQTPMQVSDRMLSGSVGKLYVAPIILKYSEEEKLSIEDNISKYFEGADWFSSLEYRNEITIKHLLNHTSGIPEYVYSEKLWQTLVKGDPSKKWTPEERLELLKGSEAHFKPGEGWSYADTNYIILGMIIEQISNKDFYSVVKEKILAPNALNNTSPSTSQKLKNLVSGYTGSLPLFQGMENKVSDNEKYIVNPQFEWTGGGFINTAEDLARWGAILFNPNRSLLDKDSIGKMLEAVNRTNGEPSKTGYGLGIEIWEDDLGLYYGHSGFMPGFMSVVQYIPEINGAIAMQINADIFSGKIPQTLRIEELTHSLREILVQYN